MYINKFSTAPVKCLDALFYHSLKVKTNGFTLFYINYTKYNDILQDKQTESYYNLYFYRSNLSSIFINSFFPVSTIDQSSDKEKGDQCYIYIYIYSVQQIHKMKTIYKMSKIQILLERKVGWLTYPRLKFM